MKRGQTVKTKNIIPLTGSQCQNMRRKLGVYQDEWGAMLGIGRATVSNMERRLEERVPKQYGWACYGLMTRLKYEKQLDKSK